MSTLADPEFKKSLFELMFGRWVYNEARRMTERRTVFDVDQLGRLAAESVGQTAADVVSFNKHAEDWFNLVFRVGLRDGRQVAAHVPYSERVPKHLAVSSEVATAEYMRRHGIPAPEINAYSPDADNDAGVPYIMMEFVQGPTLEDVWDSLSDDEIVSVVDQITQLEARMMALEFPAGGSLYFTRDLEKVSPGLGVPLSDPTFCVGPDMNETLWLGRRAELDVFRGPYQSAESAISAAAQKEIAYLEHFGQPVLPRRPEVSFIHRFEKQSPASHIALLHKYLAVVPSLIPDDPAQRRFAIRHPNLQLSDIVVARSPDAGCKIVRLLGWQHAWIMPMFLLAGVPPSLQCSGELFSEFIFPTALPDHFSSMSALQQEQAQDEHREHLTYYQYITSTRQNNRPHFRAFSDRFHSLRIQLVPLAGAAWEGESQDLKVALIQTMQDWESLAGADVPCPLDFAGEDLRETANRSIRMLREASRSCGECSASERTAARTTRTTRTPGRSCRSSRRGIRSASSLRRSAR